MPEQNPDFRDAQGNLIRGDVVTIPFFPAGADRAMITARKA
jgi:hypothetical protein